MRTSWKGRDVLKWDVMALIMGEWLILILNHVVMAYKACDIPQYVKSWDLVLFWERRKLIDGPLVGVKRGLSSMQLITNFH